KETFFKEEHLSQIRGLHATLQRLLPDIAERLQQDAAEREEKRRSDTMARQAEVLARFVDAVRDSYLGSVAQAAVAAGSPGKRPAHWEVVIRPSLIPAGLPIETLKECWSIVETARVRSNGWEY